MCAASVASGRLRTRARNSSIVILCSLCCDRSPFAGRGAFTRERYRSSGDKYVFPTSSVIQLLLTTYSIATESNLAARASDTKLAHSVIERRSIQTQTSRCAVWPANHPIRLTKHSNDVISLHG